MRVVIDTNVLRAAMWSSSGASHRLVRALRRGAAKPVLSVPLYLEYQAVLTRPEQLPPGVSREQMLGFLRRFAALAELRMIHPENGNRNLNAETQRRREAGDTKERSPKHRSPGG